MCGLWFGAQIGAHFGLVGGAVGAVLGAGIGVLVGRLPLVPAFLCLKIKFRNEARIRRAFENDEYYIFHLALAHLMAHLMARGLDVSSEKARVLDLLLSDELDRRRFGWACLQLAFPDLSRPDLSRVLPDFDFQSPSPAHRESLRQMKAEK